MTSLLNQTGWSDSNLIRWEEGLPQKFGGWQKFYQGSYSNSPVRALLAWEGGPHGAGQPESADLDYLAVATEAGISITDSNGVTTSIAPLTKTFDVTPSFTTLSHPLNPSWVDVTCVGSNLSPLSSVNILTPISLPTTPNPITLFGSYPVVAFIDTDHFTIDIGITPTSVVTNVGTLPTFQVTVNSSVVTVVLPNHGLSVGQKIDFKAPTTLGGLTVSGVYSIVQVQDVNTFMIGEGPSTSAAGPVPMNGGKAHFLLYTVIGPPPTIGAWGTAAWGAGSWGRGGTPPPYSTGTPVTAPDWTLDNWGTWLVACPDQGPIFWFDPASSFTTMRLVDSGPQINHGIFVAMPQRMLVAYGSSVNQVHDPLLVRWSNIEDFTSWTVTSTTTAGSYRIPLGNQIVSGIQTTQQALLFTDLGVWAMTYMGPPFIWGFNQIANGCGCISRHGVTQLMNTVYWFGAGNFYVMDGSGPHELPCTVWDQVFQNINRGVDQNGVPYSAKCVAAANSIFNEIMFFYPSANATEIDSYAKYSLASQAWDYGTLQRTAWIDQNVFGPPIGGDANGFVYQHETTSNADGLPMHSWITSGWFMLTEGDPVSFVDLLLPDFKWGLRSVVSKSAKIMLTVTTADYPQGPTRTKGPYTVAQTGFTDSRTNVSYPYVNTRCRGRMMRFKIESNDLDSWWRLGDFRYRGKVDGSRGD